jgi:hypothetical protein
MLKSTPFFLLLSILCLSCSRLTIIDLPISFDEVSQLYDGSFFYSSGCHPRLEAFAAGRLLIIIKSREAAKAISLRCQPQAKKMM